MAKKLVKKLTLYIAIALAKNAKTTALICIVDQIVTSSNLMLLYPFRMSSLVFVYAETLMALI